MSKTERRSFMPIIVQKFGGTSLANADLIKSVATRILNTKKRGFDVVVVCSAMGDSTDRLITLAREITEHPNPRELDVLLSTGETLVCPLVALALEEFGCQSISLTGIQAGIKTESRFGRARISDIDPIRIHQEINAGKVVVVAGFQGGNNEHEITTLGRGGSDTSAVALAASLGAIRCEIFTDVEGIFTADPRVVPNARKIPEIDYEEMLELAIVGAKMQPRSIELGAIYQIPILVTSSFTNTSGTTIHEEVNVELSNRVRGVAYDSNVAKITLKSVPDRPGIAASLFEPLANVGISVDTIVQNTGSGDITDLSFTISRSDLGLALETITPIAKMNGALNVHHESELSKVSIVGTGMQNAPGFAARMFRALAEAKINIDMITTSEIRITCIVKEEKVKEAVSILHEAFELDQDD